jgi:hypothetical protein
MNTLNIAHMQFRSQGILFLNMIAGNGVLLSLGPTLLRMRYFKRAALKNVPPDIASRDIKLQIEATLNAQLEYRALRVYVKFALVYWFLIGGTECN